MMKKVATSSPNSTTAASATRRTRYLITESSCSSRPPRSAAQLNPLAREPRVLQMIRAQAVEVRAAQVRRMGIDERQVQDVDDRRQVHQRLLDLRPLLGPRSVRAR